MNAEQHRPDATLRGAFLAYTLAYHLLAIGAAAMLILAGYPVIVGALAWCLIASVPAVFLAIIGALHCKPEDEDEDGHISPPRLPATRAKTAAVRPGRELRI
ncbi:hypothetical protein [Pararhodobacter sp.]|uniref:hypothetical protein n=1 Tax=Pararhodobacter sp. TaxID=2127056 RepID=UPI002FDDCF71